MATAVRWTVGICLPVALIFLAGGLYGDHRGWWNDQAFLTNLASSLTSLLFGLPFALLVFNSLGEAQAQRREERRVRALIRPEINELENLLLRRFRVSSLDELQHRCSGMRQGLAAASYQGRDTRQLTVMFENLYTPRDAADNPLTGEPGLRVHADWARSFRAQWEFLDNDLRPRAVQAGVEWIPHSWSAHVRATVVTLESPDNSINVDAMCEALARIASIMTRLKRLHG
ncbi:hypothetical protein [Streptomyces tunisiensis]|uniref:hypothetical protein n=1 Tax=Streptomyces tunisiensis TaxID=948699 RepID=UPI00403D9593